MFLKWKGTKTNMLGYILSFKATGVHKKYFRNYIEGGQEAKSIGLE